MMVSSWLFAGGVIGVLNTLTLWWTVARLHPDAPRSAVNLVLGGAILRWSFAAGLLIAALQRGIVPALLAFAGMWLTRWGLACWLGWGHKSSVLFEA